MSSIRKSVTSEHQSVVTKNSIPEPPKQAIGIIQPMNQNLYSGSDKNDQPVMDEDPLMFLKANGKLNGQVTQVQQQNPPNLQSIPNTQNTRGVSHLNLGGNTKIKFNNKPYSQVQQENFSPFAKIENKVETYETGNGTFFQNPSKILQSPP